MDGDELDELVDEIQRATAIGELQALVALCNRAEGERTLTEQTTFLTGAGNHRRLYGHVLSFGCCLRAYEHGEPSLIGDA